MEGFVYTLTLYIAKKYGDINLKIEKQAESAEKSLLSACFSIF